MEEYVLLLVGLTALLLGLSAGKAWERYKLREGRWIDRRKIRESPHYILGLNFLVTHQLDLAIEELTQAATLDPDALEIQMILGNLYREKGQVARAIQMHQRLLQRPKLRRLEHTYVLLCLGLDFRRGGFIDRSLEAFNDVLRLDPTNRSALANLEKLYEEQHQWEEAHALRQRLIKVGDGQHQHRDRAILAFLENEIGVQALRRGDVAEANRRFEAAIALDRSVVPAYLNLGDAQRRADNPAVAVATWEEVVQAVPERAYLVFDRLETGYADLGASHRFPDLCRKVIAANPQDWRARQALARHLLAQDRVTEALEWLFEALAQNPHGLTIHRNIWQALSRLDLPRNLVGRYIDLAHSSIFYLDPHICTRCRYRSTELLWQCPHCHEWNTFVEERIAPAKDSEECPS